MLYESDVIKAVCSYLESKGYTIHQQRRSIEKGDDIIAEQNGYFLYIEAKGETSETPITKRYGRPFTSSQVKNHLSVALFKCAEVLTRNQERNNFQVSIALPDNENHRKNVNKIRKAINMLNIRIFWVSSNQEIKVEHPTVDFK